MKKRQPKPKAQFGRITICYPPSKIDVFAAARASARVEGRSFSAWVTRLIEHEVRRSALKMIIIGGIFLRSTCGLNDSASAPAASLAASGVMADVESKAKRAA
jgi:hypothetical protein